MFRHLSALLLLALGSATVGADEGAERSRGEHIRSFAEHFEQFPGVLYVRTPEQITLSEAYPLAPEHGTWVDTRTTGNGKLSRGGQYSAAWRKTDRGWKIYSELFVALYCRGAGYRA